MRTRSSYESQPETLIGTNIPILRSNSLGFGFKERKYSLSRRPRRHIIKHGRRCVRHNLVVLLLLRHIRNHFVLRQRLQTGRQRRQRRNWFIKGRFHHGRQHGGRRRSLLAVRQRRHLLPQRWRARERRSDSAIAPLCTPVRSRLLHRRSAHRSQPILAPTSARILVTDREFLLRAPQSCPAIAAATDTRCRAAPHIPQLQSHRHPLGPRASLSTPIQDCRIISVR